LLGEGCCGDWARAVQDDPRRILWRCDLRATPGSGARVSEKVGDAYSQGQAGGAGHWSGAFDPQRAT
jgi:hypothetical protein